MTIIICYTYPVGTLGFKSRWVKHLLTMTIQTPTSIILFPHGLPRLEICQKIYRTEDFRVKNLHRKRVIFDICLIVTKSA